MNEYTGWLIDLYPHPQLGVVLWFLDEENRERRRLHHPFPTTFYAHGPSPRLREAWRYLEDQPIPVSLTKEERRDLFEEDLLPVLAIQTEDPLLEQQVFARLKKRFPDLNYYNADLPFSLRHAVRYDTFPLARCRATSTPEGEMQTLEVLDSAWEIDPPAPPLRTMTLSPDVNPFHQTPTRLEIRINRKHHSCPFRKESLLLLKLRYLLKLHDPDLLLTVWGDNWLLPKLEEMEKKHNLKLPLNREEDFQAERRPERSYHSYGRVVYRGPQVRLFGRLHIATENAVMYHDYGLEGAFEMARVSGLRVQTAARVSPGTGISAMQMRTALRQGILVPYHKQQAERPKTAYNLIKADKGGMVYQPTIGLHADVAEIDFISMYPSIMEHFNISPETVGREARDGHYVPELGLAITQEVRGLIPDTLKPLLEKRIELKSQLAHLSKRDVRYKPFQARASAHKWLLVTCFGYLGYKNARFGRIEAHESVTAYGREALLRAKEAAEDLGFRVLHMYVDGLWVQKKGASQADDFQPLLEEVLERTGLPISLNGVYRWIAFLGSRSDPRVPVANRYFGVFQDGSFKVRGIEARRRDTPPWIKEAQREMLHILAEAPSVEALPGQLPKIHRFLRTKLAALRENRVPLKELLVTQKLSRPLEEYKMPSPAARAAGQLADIGKSLAPGQGVRFLYTLGKPGIYAWDLPQAPDPENVDRGYYGELLLRAAVTVLEPLGVREETLRSWLLSNAGYGAPPGRLPERQGLPMFVVKP